MGVFQILFAYCAVSLCLGGLAAWATMQEESDPLRHKLWRYLASATFFTLLWPVAVAHSVWHWFEWEVLYRYGWRR